MTIANDKILAPPQGISIHQLLTIQSDTTVCRAAELFRSPYIRYSSNQQPALSTSTSLRPTQQCREHLLLTGSPTSAITTTALCSPTRHAPLLVQCCSRAYSDSICISSGITTSTCWQRRCARVRAKPCLTSATIPALLSWPSSEHSVLSRKSKRAC